MLKLSTGFILFPVFEDLFPQVSCFVCLLIFHERQLIPFCFCGCLSKQNKNLCLRGFLDSIKGFLSLKWALSKVSDFKAKDRGLYLQQWHQQVPHISTGVILDVCLQVTLVHWEGGGKHSRHLSRVLQKVSHQRQTSVLMSVSGMRHFVISNILLFIWAKMWLITPWLIP